MPLDLGSTALLAVPLRDHAGRVLGVLQASGKLKAGEPSGKPPPAGLKLWEEDKLETPPFTAGDAEFLSLIAERMAAQLSYLDASGP